MSDVFKIEGLADLERAMMELAAPVAKRIGVKALTRAAEPLIDHMVELAPVDEGGLRAGIDSGTRLSKRQKKLFPKESQVEVYVGPNSGVAQEGVQQEFGNENHGPQAFVRPAWDADKYDVMFDIRDELAREIDRRAQKASASQSALIAKALSGQP